MTCSKNNQIEREPLWLPFNLCLYELCQHSLLSHHNGFFRNPAGFFRNPGSVGPHEDFPLVVPVGSPGISPPSMIICRQKVTVEGGHQIPLVDYEGVGIPNEKFAHFGTFFRLCPEIYPQTARTVPHQDPIYFHNSCDPCPSIDSNHGGNQAAR